MRIALSLVFIFAACSSSSSKPDASGGPSLTCQNGASPGPESVGCDQCGQMQCAQEFSDVITSCPTLASCIAACQCTSSDSCVTGCESAASSSCQTLLATYGDCEKQAPACASACTQP